MVYQTSAAGSIASSGEDDDDAAASPNPPAPELLSYWNPSAGGLDVGTCDDNEVVAFALALALVAMELIINVAELSTDDDAVVLDVVDDISIAERVIASVIGSVVVVAGIDDDGGVDIGAIEATGWIVAKTPSPLIN